MRDPQVTLVTPKMARQILEDTETAGVMNRNIREKYVAALADDMKNDRWIVNGDVIRIDQKSGACYDGQHRLHAIVTSGKSVRTLVWYGSAKIEMPTIDTGRMRSFGDVLKLRGEKYYAVLAALVRRAVELFQGVIPDSTNRFTVGIGLEFLEAHPELRAAAEFTAHHPTMLIPSHVAYIRFKIGADGEPALARFLGLVRTGEGLSKGHPALLLRDRFIQDKIAKGKLPNPEKMALTIKAWNAYVESRPIANLRWRRLGDQPEEFPIPLPAAADELQHPIRLAALNP